MITKPPGLVTGGALLVHGHLCRKKSLRQLRRPLLQRRRRAEKASNPFAVVCPAGRLRASSMTNGSKVLFGPAESTAPKAEW